MTARRVLFLAYLFPPTGGGGVQRSLKFVKYLSRYGWEPIVLTVKPISYYVYDPVLLEELDPSVRIERTGSLDPLRLSAIALGDRRHASGARQQHRVFRPEGPVTKAYRRIRSWISFPDPQVGWLPFALARGLRLVRKYRPDVIYSPAAPYSSAVAARLLSRVTGIPYVIDFRDGWVDDEYQHRPTAIHRRGHEALERSIVTKASAVCVYGRWLAERLERRYPETAGRITEITNGFDWSDATGHAAVPDVPPGQFRIVYSGSLYRHHDQVLATFFAGLRMLPRDLRRRFEVVFVGQAPDELQSPDALGELMPQLRFLGYRSHQEAVGWLQSAHASLLLLREGDVASVTGKVFELLMVQKPILTLAEPEGECVRILRAAGAASYVVPPSDAEGTRQALIRMVEDGFPPLSRDAVAPFSRELQTGVLASVLARAAAAPRVGEGRRG